MNRRTALWLGLLAVGLWPTRLRAQDPPVGDDFADEVPPRNGRPRAGAARATRRDDVPDRGNAACEPLPADFPTEPPPERSTEVRQGVAGGETRFQVFARVTDVRRHVGVTIKADVPDDTLTVGSWFSQKVSASYSTSILAAPCGVR